MSSINKRKITHYPLPVTRYYQDGQTVVEVLVAVAIFAALSTSAVFLLLGSFESVRYGGDAEVASAFAQEGIDAARSVISQGWGELPVGGPYGLSSAAGYWQISGSGDISGKLSRAVSVGQVYRDGGGNIAPAGTLDPRTKKITAQVGWETVAGRPNLLNLISYFTLWASRAWTETTTVDFADGTFTSTQGSAVGDGAVTLAGTPGSGFTLQGSYNTPSSSFDARDVFVVGNTAYFITNDNAGGPGLYIINVANPASPTLLGSLVLNAAANGIYVSGNYAYVASTSNSQELQIVNIANPAAPALVGSYNAQTSADATDVWVAGSYAYLTTVNSSQQELYKINITNPAVPALSASVEIGGDVNRIYISGGYAYLATALDSQELTVVNLVPATPAVVGSYNSSGTSDGRDVFVDGTVAYLVTQPNAANEFYTINITNPAAPTLLGSGSWGSTGTTYSVFKNGNTVFVGNSVAASAVQYFDVTNPAAPTLTGAIATVGEGAMGLYYLNNYLYVASANNTAELQIYAQPPGGYQLGGTYTSSVFDATAAASWNFVSWSETLPAGCDIQVQIRTATTFGGISSAEWAGPNGKDGNPADWFTNAAGEAIHPDHTDDEFIQYRVYFTGPGTATGTLQDISFEYQI
jgi:hypothetical protein